MLEERTFSGSLLKNSVLLRGAGRAVGASDAGSTVDGSEDEEDITTETDDTSVSVDDVDDVEDEPRTPMTKKQRQQHKTGMQVKRGRDGRQEISTEGGLTTALPTDLASELENAQEEEEEEEGQDGNADVAKQRRMERRRKRSGTLSNDVKGEYMRIPFVMRNSHVDSMARRAARRSHESARREQGPDLVHFQNPRSHHRARRL